MASLFRNKYRIESARWKSWDYSAAGAYFITICTKNRVKYFVETPRMASVPMQLSEIGKIAESEWYRAPELRPDMNLQLGEFVVMPDHIHGIIIIGDRMGAMDGVNDNDRDPGAHGHSGIASIIRGYKSAVTTYARKNNIPFDWQTRFYDRVIRDAGEFQRISNYIRKNPYR